MNNINLSTQPYKGTRDFYPPDMRLRNWFFGKAREILRLCAYEEYDGPMLESLDIYIAKSGEEIVKEQTYHFTDKGGRDLAIRPEMTPTVARMIAAKVYELNMPLKWFSIPNLYRYERPQRGRLREHWQINVDIFGCNSYEADLEVIYIAVMLLEAFGADESMFKIHINNRKFFNDAMSAVSGLQAEDANLLSKVVDRRDKIARDRYVEELLMLGLTNEQVKEIDALYSMTVEEIIATYPESRGAKELGQLFDAIKGIHIEKYCKFDFSVIRGFDYYTGTVFEVFDTAPKNIRSMFGGGRYDNLVELFTNNISVPGVGFGFGDVTLENFLETHDLIPDTFTAGPKVLITRFPEVPYIKYAELSAKLRKARIVNSIYLGDKRIGKQIQFAVQEGYSHIIIMGGFEMEKNVVSIKDLSANEEVEYPLDSFIQYFNTHI